MKNSPIVVIGKLFKFLIIATCPIFFAACLDAKKINYLLIEKAAINIERAVDSLAYSNIKTRENLKIAGNIGCILDYCEGSLLVKLTYIQNCPEELKKVFKRTNRFIHINKYKIPVLFGLEDGNSILLKKQFPNIVRCYLMELDNEGNVLVEGYAY